ncbi:hypothetical protein DFJ77DRAFT_454051 [Powellomyces hirtus]|nr:hypothetical protein DFJ77DRAFT_481981 [Powellomyces hirtus]KAI8919379.1 hypothetical protein DFJ77DRAFT_454051 [Powellomyces hirtus]
MFALGRFFRGTHSLSSAIGLPVPSLRAFHVGWAVRKVATGEPSSPSSFKQEPANNKAPPIKTHWRWTPEEDDVLTESRSTGLSYKAISRHLNRRSEMACMQRVVALRHPAVKFGPFKPVEDTQILEAQELSLNTGSRLNVQSLAQGLGRSAASVRKRLRWLETRNTRRVGAWTAAEVEYLSSALAATPAGQTARWTSLAVQLKRSASSVQQKSERLSAAVDSRPWSKEDDERLAQYVSAASFSGERIQWTHTARLLKRPAKETRLRWSTVLDPEMKHGAWSLSENDTLRNLVDEARLAGNAPSWLKWEAIFKRLFQEMMTHYRRHLQPTGQPSRTRFSLEEDEAFKKMVKLAKENYCRPSWVKIGEALGRTQGSVWSRWNKHEKRDAALRK